MVGEKEDLSLLEAEYVSDEVYQAKVKDLLQKYRYIRRTRPDGNCFYRAFAYAYFERLLYYPLEYARYVQKEIKMNCLMLKINVAFHTKNLFFILF